MTFLPVIIWESPYHIVPFSDKISFLGKNGEYVHLALCKMQELREGVRKAFGVRPFRERMRNCTKYKR